MITTIYYIHFVVINIRADLIIDQSCHICIYADRQNDTDYTHCGAWNHAFMSTGSASVIRTVKK